MKFNKTFIRLFVLMCVISLCSCVSGKIFPEFGTPQPGPIVLGKTTNSTEQVWIPYSATPMGITPTVATETYVNDNFVSIQNPSVTKQVFVTNPTSKPLLDLSMYSTGSNHTDAPKTMMSAQYLSIGGREYGTGTYRMIGFGYRGYPSDSSPVEIGMVETDSTDQTSGDFIVATRPTNKLDEPNIRFTVTSKGQIKGNHVWPPTESTDLTTKAYVDSVAARTTRPASPQTGMMYFSTVQDKPEWYNGSKWVYADGTDAQP